MDDYDGHMIFGDLVGLKLPDIRLTGEGKNPKKPHTVNLSRPGIEPRPAAWQARMLPLAPQRWTGSFTCRKSTTRDPRLLPFRRKSYSGFLHSEKIHQPRPGLNPRTTDPVADSKYNSFYLHMFITSTRFDQHLKCYKFISLCLLYD